MFELAKFIELTPNVQYIINPALNPGANSTMLFGLRFRAAF